MRQAVASTLDQIVARAPTRQFPSLGARLFVILLVIALIPITAVNLALVSTTRSRLADLAVANLRQRSAFTAATMDGYIQARRQDIILVSGLPDVIAYLQNQTHEGQREAARAAFAATVALTPAYESIAALSLDGTIVAASLRTDEGSNVRFRDYYQNARAGAVFVSDPSYSVITNRPALFFSAPVKTTNGVLVGVVRSRLNLTQIWDLTEADAGSVGEGASAMLLDDYGIRLAVSETRDRRDQAEALIYKPIAPIDFETAKRLAADRRFGQKSAEQLVVDPLPELKAVLDGLRPGGDGAFTYQANGVERRGVATRLTSKPWAYVVALPPSSYTGVVSYGVLDFLAGLAVAVALAAAGAALIYGWLFGPLRRIAGYAQQVAGGAVSPQEASFAPLARDDLSREVASAFDRFVARLRQLTTHETRQQ